MQTVYGCLISLGQRLSFVIAEIVDDFSVVYFKGSSENLCLLKYMQIDYPQVHSLSYQMSVKALQKD